MKNLSSANEFVLGNRVNEYKYNALFARLTYDWENKYIVNLNLRRDGSSRFGPGRQFGNFGSIGTAWIFSEEGFIKRNISVLSFGKLRASYGITGNDGIPDYAYLERYENVRGNYQDIKGYITSGLYNESYGWETTKKFELSLEAGFFNDRVFLQSVFYRNRSSNQLARYPLPLMSGPGSLTVNLPALLENKGLEFALTTRNVKGDNFSWTTNANLSVNKNQLLNFPDLATSPYYLDYVIGQPVGMTKVYNFAGVNSETGQYTFFDKDGNVTLNPSEGGNANKTEFINTQPKFFGGFSNTFTYKNLMLDVFFQFVKQEGRNYLFGFEYIPGRANLGMGNQPIEVLNRWQKAGDNTMVQRFSSGMLSDSYQFASESNLAYSDASFIRLKNVSISYKLPKIIVNKIGFNEVDFYLQGQNLLTITKYKGLDPETQSVTALPPLKVLVLGLKLRL